MLRRNKESGQALVFGVATLGILLIGIAGLGIDMGYLRYQKRLLQGAADSAAIAGASDLPTAFGGVTLAAQNAATASGYTATATLATCPPPAPASAVGSVALTVNNGPCSGPHNGLSNYVEVYLSQVEPTFFMRVFGTTSETITARAVATALSGGNNSGCLYTLGPPSSGIGVNISGNAHLIAPTCGIVDNGRYDPTGGSLTIESGSFSVAAPTCNGNPSGCGVDISCGPTQADANCPAFGSPPGPNPEASLTPPTQPAASSSCPGPVKGKAVACDVSTSGTTTLQPGTYSSIDFGKNSTTTLAAGIYYINGTGGVTFEGNATVTDDPSNGVMFYFTCPPGTSPCSNGATLNAVGGGNVPDLRLTAPSTLTGANAQYNGIMFYQDPNDTHAPSLGGDDNTALNGVLYFPSVQLTFFGNNHFTAGIVVADSVSFSGNPTVTLSGTAGLPTGVSFVTSAVLVE